MMIEIAMENENARRRMRAMNAHALDGNLALTGRMAEHAAAMSRARPSEGT